MPPTPADSHTNRCVLIVEDEPRLRSMLLRAVPDMGFDPIAAGTGEEAMRMVREQPPAIAVLDLNLPGIDGLSLFEKLREGLPRLQVIIMTGYGDLAAAQRSIRLGVADFLTKPCSLGELEQALDRAWRRRITEQDMPASVSHAKPHHPPAQDLSIDTDLPRKIQDVEKDLIINALDRNHGNRIATARELGISVRTLYYRLSYYGLKAD